MRHLRLGFRSVNFTECVSKGAVDSFAYMERGGCLYILPTRGFWYYIITPSLKKRENSAGSAGKSEKSAENILQKVFQNAYTDYTDIGLDLHQLLDTMPLHPTGRTWLIDIRKFVEGFLKSISGLRFATKRLAVFLGQK